MGENLFEVPRADNGGENLMEVPQLSLKKKKKTRKRKEKTGLISVK